MVRFLTMLSLDPAVERTSVSRVEGMACSPCANAIDKTPTVVADAAVLPERIEQVIESAGSYQAEPLAGDGTPGSAAP